LFYIVLSIFYVVLFLFILFYIFHNCLHQPLPPEIEQKNSVYQNKKELPVK